MEVVLSYINNMTVPRVKHDRCKDHSLKMDSLEPENWSLNCDFTKPLKSIKLTDLTDVQLTPVSEILTLVLRDTYGSFYRTAASARLETSRRCSNCRDNRIFVMSNNGPARGGDWFHSCLNCANRRRISAELIYQAIRVGCRTALDKFTLMEWRNKKTPVKDKSDGSIIESYTEGGVVKFRVKNSYSTPTPPRLVQATADHPITGRITSFNGNSYTVSDVSNTSAAQLSWTPLQTELAGDRAEDINAIRAVFGYSPIPTPQDTSYQIIHDDTL